MRIKKSLGKGCVFDPLLMTTKGFLAEEYCDSSQAPWGQLEKLQQPETKLHLSHFKKAARLNLQPTIYQEI